MLLNFCEYSIKHEIITSCIQFCNLHSKTPNERNCLYMYSQVVYLIYGDLSCHNTICLKKCGIGYNKIIINLD